MSRRPQATTPLAASVGFAALAGTLAALFVSSLVLHHRLGVPMWQVVAAGSPVALVLCGLAALAAGRFARVLEALRLEVGQRMSDPDSADQPTAVVPAWAGTELRDLARTVDGLALRVRMTDDMAERHRRLAETASAGMFELLSGLVAAEEGARGQLAAELHDTVAQSLMTARALMAEGTDDPRRRNLVAELIAEAEEQVRAVMARTRPPALRERDLARAVTGLRDDLRHRYAVDVTLCWPIEPHPLPLATAVTVYRFFQEALLNVVKHADVEAAVAELSIDNDWVCATVRDDGPGFDPAEVHSEGGRHVGLGLLRERARLLGGSVDVASWPAQGVCVTLRLPRGAGSGIGLMPSPQPGSALRAAPGRDRGDARRHGRQAGGCTEQLAERHDMSREVTQR